MTKIKKVLILYPPIVLSEGERPSYTFPMGAGYIAAVLEQAGYEVSCLDCIVAGRDEVRQIGDGLCEYGLSVERVLEQVAALEPDLVGISCQFSVQYTPTRTLIEVLKQNNPTRPIVLGGTHSSAQPEDVLEQTAVDYLVLSEGEQTMVELLDCLSGGEPVSHLDGLAWRDAGEIRLNPRTRFIQDLDELPFPARHLFDMEAYFDTPRGWGEDKGSRRLSLITSRGCPFGCSFCGIQLNTGKKFRMRSAGNVLSELEHVVETYGITEVMFEDDNISLHKGRFLEILQGMMARFGKIFWTATSGMALWTLDDEVLVAMQKSGCERIYLGIESGNERVLREVIRKHMTKLDDIRAGVARIKHFGMSTVGFWVLGSPGETKREMWDTLDFARELQLDFNQVLIALPYRGTELYQVCLENDYFAASSELDPDNMVETKAMIKTPEFSPEDVLAIQQAGRFRAILRQNKGLISALIELFQRHGWFSLRVIMELVKRRYGYYS